MAKDTKLSLLYHLFAFATVFCLLIFPLAVVAQGSNAVNPGGSNAVTGGSNAVTGGSNAVTTGGGDSVVGLQNPLGSQSLIGFFESILDVIMIFAVPIIVFFIIYAGFLYVTAQGNESKVSTAHMALLYAVIGGVIILGARVILAVISGTISSF